MTKKKEEIVSELLLHAGILTVKAAFGRIDPERGCAIGKLIDATLETLGEKTISQRMAEDPEKGLADMREGISLAMSQITASMPQGFQETPEELLKELGALTALRKSGKVEVTVCDKVAETVLEDFNTWYNCTPQQYMRNRPESVKEYKFGLNDQLGHNLMLQEIVRFEGIDEVQKTEINGSHYDFSNEPEPCTALQG